MNDKQYILSLIKKFLISPVAFGILALVVYLIKEHN